MEWQIVILFLAPFCACDGVVHLLQLAVGCEIAVSHAAMSVVNIRHSFKLSQWSLTFEQLAFCQRRSLRQMPLRRLVTPHRFNANFIERFFLRASARLVHTMRCGNSNRKEMNNNRLAISESLTPWFPSIAIMSRLPGHLRSRDLHN